MEEISQGNQEEFAIHWKRWTAERVARFENTGSRIGAMGTRGFDVHEPTRVCGSDAVVRPDECREAERACVNTTSDQNCST